MVKIALNEKNLLVILFIAGLAIGFVAGYYLGQPKAPKSPFVQYASDLKLDAGKFESCLDNGKYVSDISADYTLATRIGLTGTPAFVINGRLTNGALPYASFKTLLDNELINSSNRSLALTLVNEKDYTLGGKDAPIVMIEFSDFQCYYCGKFATETFESIKKDYIDTGKVLFIHKDFPLTSIHPLAQKAAEAAACAAEQGKYWEYSGTLFEKQAEWGGE